VSRRRASSRILLRSTPILRLAFGFGPIRDPLIRNTCALSLCFEHERLHHELDRPLRSGPRALTDRRAGLRDGNIRKQVAEGETLSARQGDGEALLKSYDSRRADALKLRRLGDDVDVPDEAEQARLQRSVADAKEEPNTICAVRLLREEERLKVIAAGLPHFDAEAEESARAYEALGETLLAALADFQAVGQAKGAAWGRSREGRKELRLDQMPGVGYHDLGHLKSEIQDAIRKTRSAPHGRPTVRSVGASSRPGSRPRQERGSATARRSRPSAARRHDERHRDPAGGGNDCDGALQPRTDRARGARARALSRPKNARRTYLHLQLGRDYRFFRRGSSHPPLALEHHASASISEKDSFMLIYFLISIAVVNVLGVVVMARLERRLSGTTDELRHPVARRGADPVIPANLSCGDDRVRAHQPVPCRPSYLTL